MSVTCGVNSEAETAEHRMFACHHCGMPVCEQHGWIVSIDEAFDDGSGQQVSDGSDTNALVSRAAMHCPRCADEIHRGADRHNGWTDTRPEAPRVAPGRT